MGLGRQRDRQIRWSYCALSALPAADGRADPRLDRDQPVAGYPGRRRNRGNRRCGADRRPATGCLSRQGIRCMAKASFALALWLCTSLSVLAATPKKKPDEQVRVQRRMQAWAKLTPKERQAARERYKKMEKLPPEKKQGLKQQWEEYNRLPEQERRKLGSTPRKPAAPTRPAKSPAEPTPPPAAPPALSGERVSPVAPTPPANQ